MLLDICIYMYDILLSLLDEPMIDDLFKLNGFDSFYPFHEFDKSNKITFTTFYRFEISDMGE